LIVFCFCWFSVVVLWCSLVDMLRLKWSLLSLLLVVVIGVCKAQEILYIGDAEDFMSFSNLSQTVDNFTYNVIFTADIDLTRWNLDRPLGLRDDMSCMPFSGVMDARGFSIIGVNMGGTDTDSALFCGLRDAVIGNLVIDKSCSFSGSSASALSLTASSYVGLVNVKNYARVEGHLTVGGFFANVEGTDGATLEIINCTNAGELVCTRDQDDGKNTLLSAFIGYLHNNQNMKVIVQNCVNDGVLLSTRTGKQAQVGAFCALMDQISSSTIQISDFVNNGNIIVRASSGRVGGLFGIVYYGESYTLELSGCVNNGNIDYSGEDSDGSQGGFIGYISKSKKNKIDFTHCVNNGEVKTQTAVSTTTTGCSGFVGSMFAEDGFQININFISCQNNGNILSNGPACGFFCLPSESNYNAGINPAVYNSVNKGVLFGIRAYGVSNIVNTAQNVVSLGTVYGTSESYFFWKDAGTVSSLFGLQRSCVNCSDSVVQFDDNSALYYTVSDHTRVDSLLNQEVLSNSYSVGWSKKLDVNLTIVKGPLDIKTLGDFELFYDLLSQKLLEETSLNITLETDLDLSNSKFNKPIGLSDDGDCWYFTGIFEGNGHVINNLKLDIRTGSASFFCGVRNAKIKNMIIGSSCDLKGNLSSSLVTHGTGKIILENIHNKANILGHFRGSAFLQCEEDCWAIIKDCVNEGHVKGENSAFGFVFVQRQRVIILNSINKGLIEGTDCCGFSNAVMAAHNVVNFGEVKTLQYNTKMFYFWEFCVAKLPSIYCYDKVCGNTTNGDFTLFDNEDSQYRLKNKKKTLLIDQLNSNAEEMGYDKLWDYDLLFS